MDEYEDKHCLQPQICFLIRWICMVQLIEHWSTLLLLHFRCMIPISLHSSMQKANDKSMGAWPWRHHMSSRPLFHLAKPWSTTLRILHMVSPMDNSWTILSQVTIFPTIPILGMFPPRTTWALIIMWNAGTHTLILFHS